MSNARSPVSSLLIAKLAFLALFCAGTALCHAQTDSVVCSRGDGGFGITFRTGVTVEVGAARRDGLATRMCEATLGWDKRSLVVADAAAQLDIDALGVDLGLGTPVVAFQVKRADADCCRTLLIYSLQKPPKLLRTITGGSFFSAADAELDGQIEIWTNDAVSARELYDTNGASAELAPSVVLRFVRGRLLDVSAQFQASFDNQIAALRGELNSDDLRDFKSSNGRLPPTAHFSAEDLRRSENLLRTKMKVLRIVSAYLYSGREQMAWKTLEELWPVEDFDRIRAAMASARAKGILAQVDGVAAPASSRAGLTKVYDIRSQSVEQPDLRFSRRIGTRNEAPVVPPVPILIDRQGPANASETDVSSFEILLDLTIDSAGKVRSAQSNDPTFETLFKNATARWKFIPAFSGHDPVASRIYLFVSPKR